MAPPKSFLVIGIALLLTFASADKQYVPFSYTGATGPEKWGSLSPSYAACSNGKSQSPVNIVKKELVNEPKLGPLSRTYNATDATLINNGFNIGIKFEDGAGTANILGKTYTLKQMHWHSPSEHTISGKQHAAEAHLVHLASDGSVAVVSILYELGEEDAFVSQIKDGLADLSKQNCGGDQEVHVPISLKSLKKNTKKYYTYEGSLTVPPCSEKVTWVILGKVKHISKEQLEAMKAPLAAEYKNNFRPIQPLNGRKVQIYNEASD